MQALAAEWQKWAEQRFQIIHGLQCDVDHRRGSDLIRVHETPWFLLGDVLIRPCVQGHRSLQRGLQLDTIYAIANRLEASTPALNNAESAGWKGPGSGTLPKFR